MAIYKIGRAEGNHIVLADKSISRRHAELEELGSGRFRLRDVGSSAGTQVLSGADWIDAKEVEVRHDTRIRLGEYETTPMELLRDQDKTMIQAKPAAAAPPPPVAKAPPAPPKPAPPPPRPAAGPGDKKMLLILGGGLAAFLLLAVIVIVAVLVGGG